jgi:hypothetical protein
MVPADGHNWIQRSAGGAIWGTPQPSSVRTSSDRPRNVNEQTSTCRLSRPSKWIIGLLVIVLLAVAGAVLGSQYNVLSQLNLPSIPISGDTATTAGIIAGIAALVVTLLAAVLGGKLGERYHRKIDRVGYQA